ncbi:MAG: YggT family protein, partial [Thiobacillus sp.]|nr:YggT family protein [Thiobacillus sp.]
MISGALAFLIQTLGNLFVIAVLLRFMMQLFRVPFRNPFAQFIVALTDFAVKPLRRVVPGFFGLDWACL